MPRVLPRLNRYFRADIYARLFPYIKPYKLSMAVVIALTLVQTGIGLLDPWPLAVVIDNGIRGQPVPSWITAFVPWLAGSGARTIIVAAVVFGIGLRVAGSILEVGGAYLKTRVNDSIAMRFRADLFQHLQRLSFSYHDRTTIGDSMYRLEDDAGFASTLLWGNFRHLLTSVLTLVGMAVIVFRLDWKLALISLAAAPILYGTAMFYGTYFRERSKRVKRLESLTETVVQEVLSCLRVVKAFGTEEREQQRCEATGWAALRARWQLTLQQDIYGSGLSLITKVFRSIVLLVGAFHVLSGDLTLGQLTVIIAYVTSVHEPLEETGSTLIDMQYSLASAERVLEVLDIRPEIEDRPDALALPTVLGDVSFESVSFGYEIDRLAVTDISLHAPPGTVTAIVGPTGAGKTTLSNLIARFYDPVQGRVLLDGHDLRKLSVATLRQNIALVIQEPILFSDSIRHNIAYGRPDASMEEIVAAAKAANAHTFIQALPDGYATEVGARGVRLSGGERQRIAIARAFLKDAPVLILDEPTSSVDSRTELVILNALDRLMQGRTTFIIAHRLSTIRRADQVLVIEDGRIIERGKHHELIRRNGLYAQLYHIQSAAFGETRELGPPMTVAQWIADAQPGAQHEEIVAAAMAADADGLIQELPAGYDTVIGDGGFQLSVEQRQSLSLARTVLAEILERKPGSAIS